MIDTIKKIAAVLGLVSMFFGGYLFIDSSYARNEKVEQLAMRVDNTDLGLKIIILEKMLAEKREQQREARKAKADELVQMLQIEIDDLARRIELLQKEALAH